MTRSRFSTKVVLLATAIGLSTVAFAGSQPVAAQSYTCPAGLAYDPSYGCTLGGDYGYYGHPYGLYYGRHHEFGHGFGHGMGAGGSIVRHGMGFHHSIVGIGHFGGGGFGDGMGMGIAGGHNIGGGFGHGGGGGHR